MQMKGITIVALSLTLAATAAADEIQLKSGGSVHGRIIEDAGGKLKIETGSGTITVDRADVVSIRPGRTAMDDFDDRRAVLDEDASSFARLGAWAERRGLRRQAREMFEKTVELDAENETARRALGFVRYDGKWLTREEVNLAMGLVREGDRWVSPAERLLHETARVEAELARLKAGIEKERIALERKFEPKPERVVVRQPAYVLGIQPALYHGPRVFPPAVIYPYAYPTYVYGSGGAFVPAPAPAPAPLPGPFFAPAPPANPVAPISPASPVAP